MKPTSRLLSDFFQKTYGSAPGSVRVRRLGSGSHGSGYLVSYLEGRTRRRVIVKYLEPEIGLGHDYPSDRAAVFLQARDSYGKLPRHVKALDVLALSETGEIFSVGGGREYYLVMEEARGDNYFRDLRAMAAKPSLDGPDRKRIEILAGYLACIHSRRRQSPRLYLRKLRDIIGHGECLMGVFDTYAEAGDAAGFTSLAEMADIEKSCIDWRARLKPLTGRLCTIHGDFHPGNILFGAADEFILLDRSRGEYGDAADDLTAFAINFIFFSLMEYGTMKAAYREALEYFFDEYIRATGDRQVLSVLGPFFAFRGAVVANPLFYPDVSSQVRSRIFGFVHGILKSEVFDPAKVDEYMDYGIEYRKRFA
jgi:hypothetical protein